MRTAARKRRLCERLRTRPFFSLYNPEAPDSRGDAGLIFAVAQQQQQQQQQQQGGAGSSSSSFSPSASGALSLTSRLVSKKRFGVGLRKAVREGLDEATRRQLFDQNHESVSSSSSSSSSSPSSSTSSSSSSSNAKGNTGDGGKSSSSGGGEGAAAFKAALTLLEQLGVASAVEFDMEPHMAYYCNNRTVWHGRSDVVRGYQRLLVRQHLAFFDSSPSQSGGHSTDVAAAAAAAAAGGTSTEEVGAEDEGRRPLSAHRRLREALDVGGL